MARLLETQLPNALTEVSPDLYNRMIRILQLNLGSFDPTETPQYTLTTMNQNQFNAGDVIWNLNAKSLQVYDGAKWNAIYSGSDNGLSATGAVGTLSVSTNGAISIDL
jgi:hypothetical protein